MKKILKNRSFKKLLAKVSPKRFDGLASAKTALILFRNEKPEKSVLAISLEKMFTTHKVKMIFVGYLPFKLEKGKEHEQGYFYKNQLNWLGFPKTQFVQDLTNKEFDVIIDLDEELDSPNNFILLSAKAGIRVGVNKQKDFYDLIVTKANNTEESVINEIEFYLKNIVKA